MTVKIFNTSAFSNSIRKEGQKTHHQSASMASFSASTVWGRTENCSPDVQGSLLVTISGSGMSEADAASPHGPCTPPQERAERATDGREGAWGITHVHLQPMARTRRRGMGDGETSGGGRRRMKTMRTSCKSAGVRARRGEGDVDRVPPIRSAISTDLGRRTRASNA
jgi:hypothetical protein